jgi:hypothetical protein
MQCSTDLVSESTYSFFQEHMFSHEPVGSSQFWITLYRQEEFALSQ